jgi:uncharacterized membrane protein YtjA (UPF0391 family)
MFGENAVPAGRRIGTILSTWRFPDKQISVIQSIEVDMLGWALTFLIIALIAAVLGFGGIAGVAVEAAKIVFFAAIILFAISAIVGLVRGRAPRLP